MPGKHVAVLMGGWSAEREVSLSSGKPCAAALESKGYRVTKIEPADERLRDRPFAVTRFRCTGTRDMGSAQARAVQHVLARGRIKAKECP